MTKLTVADLKKIKEQIAGGPLSRRRRKRQNHGAHGKLRNCRRCTGSHECLLEELAAADRPDMRALHRAVPSSAAANQCLRPDQRQRAGGRRQMDTKRCAGYRATAVGRNRVGIGGEKLTGNTPDCCPSCGLPLSVQTQTPGLADFILIPASENCPLKQYAGRHVSD